MGKKKTDVSKLMIRYSESEIKGLEREVRDLLDESRVQKVKVEMSTKRLMQLHKRSKEIFYWSIPFILLGLALTITGFSLWYWRVQKPLDLLLQK